MTTGSLTIGSVSEISSTPVVNFDKAAILLFAAIYAALPCFFFITDEKYKMRYCGLWTGLSFDSNTQSCNIDDAFAHFCDFFYTCSCINNCHRKEILCPVSPSLRIHIITHISVRLACPHHHVICLHHQQLTPSWHIRTGCVSPTLRSHVWLWACDRRHGEAQHCAGGIEPTDVRPDSVDIVCVCIGDDVSAVCGAPLSALFRLRDGGGMELGERKVWVRVWVHAWLYYTTF